MKEIFRDDLNNAVIAIMDGLDKIVKLDRIQKEQVDILLDEELDKLCDYPDYRNYN